MMTSSPYVKLLGKMDHREEAWRTSRPMFSEENMNFDGISKADISLNSMLIYTFEIRSSALFRDLIFSVRPINGWALSTRSMPIGWNTITISSEHNPSDECKARITKVINAVNRGDSIDSVRGLLPMSMSTVYTVTIDFRSLVAFLKTLSATSPYLFFVYGLKLIEAAGIENDYLTTKVKESTEYYHIRYEERVPGITRTGGMVIGSYTMKSALASQFLRQHYSKIKTGLWNMLIELTPNDTRNLCIYQDHPIDVVFYIDHSSYKKLMSMRSHWILDWHEDMWGGLVGDYVKDMSTEEFWEFIPAGGGREDPFFAEAYNRVTGEDPNVPCPIMTEWKGAIHKRKLELGDNIILKKYMDLFDEGFIKDNPDNEHRVKYIQMKTRGER